MRACRRSTTTAEARQRRGRPRSLACLRPDPRHRRVSLNLALTNPPLSLRRTARALTGARAIAKREPMTRSGVHSWSGSAAPRSALGAELEEPAPVATVPIAWSRVAPRRQSWRDSRCAVAAVESRLRADSHPESEQCLTSFTKRNFSFVAASCFPRARGFAMLRSNVDERWLCLRIYSCEGTSTNVRHCAMAGGVLWPDVGNNCAFSVTVGQVTAPSASG